MADPVAQPLSPNAGCPLCGGRFHCGAQDAACDCGQVRLDDATLADLRLRFDGCLCVACLRALPLAHGSGAGREGHPAAQHCAPAEEFLTSIQRA